MAIQRRYGRRGGMVQERRPRFVLAGSASRCDDHRSPPEASIEMAQGRVVLIRFCHNTALAHVQFYPFSWNNPRKPSTGVALRCSKVALGCTDDKPHERYSLAMRPAECGL